LPAFRYLLGIGIPVVTYDTRMIGEVDRMVRLMDGQAVDGAKTVAPEKGGVG